VIFPNLIILDLMGVVVRKITPTAAGHTKVTQWSLATTGEAADMRARRLDNFITFQGPGGFATPDDLEAAGGLPGRVSHRRWCAVVGHLPGMHREQQRPVLLQLRREADMRAFWRQWQKTDERRDDPTLSVRQPAQTINNHARGSMS